MTVFPPGSFVDVDTFAGAVTVGGVVSCTVTVPVVSTGVESSVVVSQVTVVCPSGKWPLTSKSPLPLVPDGTSQVAASGFPLVALQLRGRARELALESYLDQVRRILDFTGDRMGLDTRSAGGSECAAAGTRPTKTSTPVTPARRSIPTPRLGIMFGSPLPRALRMLIVSRIDGCVQQDRAAAGTL